MCHTLLLLSAVLMQAIFCTSHITIVDFPWILQVREYRRLFLGQAAILLYGFNLLSFFLEQHDSLATNCSLLWMRLQKSLAAQGLGNSCTG